MDTAILLHKAALRGTAVHTIARGRTAPEDACQPHWKGACALEVSTGLIQPTERNQMQSKRNIAARAARWSATHRKVAIFGWLAFVVLALFVGGAVGHQAADRRRSRLRRGRPRRSGDRKGAKLTPSGEVVLVQSEELTASDPQFEAAVGEATRQARRARLGAPGQLAGGRRRPGLQGRPLGTGRIPRSPATTNRPKNGSTPASPRPRRCRGPIHEMRVEQFGDASASKAVEYRLRRRPRARPRRPRCRSPC